MLKPGLADAPCPAVPIVGMRPRSFVCAGCAREVSEDRYGSGFAKCGAVQHDGENMVCPRCVSLVMELLAAIRGGTIKVFADELGEGA